MRIQFWGTRGSISKPGPTTVRYGGNTSCVEIQSDDGTRVVLDCGTGAHGLGQHLMSTGEKPVRGHLLIGHTHWDHIQGIPFFTPLFVEGNEWDIYAPRGLRQHVRDTLAGQMQHTYFPVTLDQLGATIRYHDLAEGTFQLGGIRVDAHYLNHPAVTLGYRLEAGGARVVYATDHEPHARHGCLGASPALNTPDLVLHGEDKHHAAFIEDADLLIHDAQYTSAEYPSKVGWGHSTIDYVVAMSVAARVRRLALFHHDPLRDDDQLDEIVRSTRERLAAIGSTLEIFAAAEGQVIELDETVPARTRGPAPVRAHEIRSSNAAATNTVLVATEDPALAAILEEALRPDGFKFVQSADPAGVVAEVSRLLPALVVLGRRGENWDAFELCKTLRTHKDPDIRDVPVVLITGISDSVELAAGFAAGATDWLTQPSSAIFIRSRIRSWLMRTQARWFKPATPADETQRLADVRQLGLLDTPPEERFDRLTRITARALDMPFAFLGLIEADRQWFKSSSGVALQEIPRDISMCAHTILKGDVLVVPDAEIDADFGDNPGFHNEHEVRFYAGVPVRGPSGRAVGTICVWDRRPRQLHTDEIQLLRDVAALAERELRGPA